jgi:protoporphyrinogen oxidase
VHDWQALEQIPVVDWLTRWSGRGTVEKVWLPLLRSKLGDNYKVTSAAFIWATIARMYAARRSGMKREMFGYVPGGYAQILSKFSETLASEGVQFHVRHAATRVSAHDGRVEITFDNGHVVDADEVVLTMPSSTAAAVCEGLSDEERQRLTAIRYQGIICASLLLERPLADFYVTNIVDANVPFTAVIEMSALVDRTQFGGRSLVYLPKYVDENDPSFSLSDDDVHASFTAALFRMYPHLQPSDIRAFRVSRVRRVFALPTLGYSTRLPGTTTSVPGVHIVNSSHIVNGTLNVNETVRLADRFVADRIAMSGAS